MPSTLNAFQIAVLETYANGEFKDLAKVPRAEFEATLEQRDENLLSFILHEISAEQGCHTVSDAILRLASAAEEIDNIIYTLYSVHRAARTPPARQ